MYQAADDHQKCRQMSVENGLVVECLLQKLIFVFQRKLRDNTSPSRVPPSRDHGVSITRFCPRGDLTWETARAVATDRYLPGQTSAA